MGVQARVRAVFMRGGTSRGIVFREADLKDFPLQLKNRIILCAIGSPDCDKRQIDGLGGGVSSLSKIAIVGKSDRENCDANYKFGQAAIDTAEIDWHVTCGNFAAAAACFAFDENFCGGGDVKEKCSSNRRVLNIYDENAGNIFKASLYCEENEACVDGSCKIDGVPGMSSPINLEYESPSCSLGKGLLATKKPMDVIRLRNGKDIRATLLDLTLPTAFVLAEDVGVTQPLSTAAMQNDGALMDSLEEIRRKSAVLFGMAQTEDGTGMAQPKVSLIGPPQSYTASDGLTKVEKAKIDMVGRAVSLGVPHKTFPMALTMAVAAGASVKGSVFEQVMGGTKSGKVVVGHPAGKIAGECVMDSVNGSYTVKAVKTERTARRIMEGSVLIPRSVFEGYEQYYR
eukprot:Nk52_evm3s390 gene=Nk52_evmTU3s390